MEGKWNGKKNKATIGTQGTYKEKENGRKRNEHNNPRPSEQAK